MSSISGSTLDTSSQFQGNPVASANYEGLWVSPGPSGSGFIDQDVVLKIGEQYTISWTFNSTGHTMVLGLEFITDTHGNGNLQSAGDRWAYSLLNTQTSNANAEGTDPTRWPRYSYDWTVSTMNLSLPTDPTIFCFNVNVDGNSDIVKSLSSHDVNITRKAVKADSSSVPTTLSASASSSPTGAIAASSAPSTNRKDDSNNGFAVRAKLGLVTGLPIFFGLLILAIGFGWWRIARRRRRNRDNHPTDAGSDGFTGGKAELDANGLVAKSGDEMPELSSDEKKAIPEMGQSKEKVWELPHENEQEHKQERYELWAGHAAAEIKA